MNLSTKEKIVDQAQKLFASKGYNGVSVREIAMVAGVNVSSISYHFGGKRNLYLRCLEEFGKNALRLSEQLLGSQSVKEDFQPRLEAFALEFFKDYSSRPELLKLVVKEIGENKLLGVCRSNDVFYQVFELLKAFLASGGSPDSETDASLFMGCVLQAILFDDERKLKLGKSIKDNNEYREKYAKRMVEVLCFGLRAKKE